MIIDKLNELKQLTAQEQAVVEYINVNPKALIDMNVNQLAQASFTSASTIIRLCKKLDVKGYTELRFMYSLEYPEMMKQRKTLKVKPFDPSTTIDEIIETLPLIYSKTIDYTQTMLSRNTIVRVTNLMKQAQRIEIYGDGVNYDLGRLMVFRFENVHKDCFVYSASHWEHIKYLEQQKIPTLAILLSHTGKNPMVIDAAKRLKASHIKTVSISANSDPTLANLTDENIQIIERNNELELQSTMFQIGVQYVLDLCISSLLVYNHEKVEKIIKELGDARGKWMK